MYLGRQKSLDIVWIIGHYQANTAQVECHRPTWDIEDLTSPSEEFIAEESTDDCCEKVNAYIRALDRMAFRNTFEDLPKGAQYGAEGAFWPSFSIFCVAKFQATRNRAIKVKVATPIMISLVKPMQSARAWKLMTWEICEIIIFEGRARVISNHC